MTIIAAADGSALGNPGPAGWAWYIDNNTWHAGGWKRGTNNQGELMAVLDLLRSTAHTGEPLTILCDSQYVINSVTKWMKGWKKKGWKKADGKPVLNQDLLKDIDAALEGRDVSFEWVKGHAGHPLNEAADDRARGAATAFQGGKDPDEGPGYPGAAASVPDAVGSGSGEGIGGRGAGAGRAKAEAASATSAQRQAPPGTQGEPAPSGAEGEDSLPGLDDAAGLATPVGVALTLEAEVMDAVERQDPETLRFLLSPGFRGVGAGGELLDAASLAASEAARPTVDGVERLAEELLGEVVQLAYLVFRGPASSVLTSWWRRESGRWRCFFRQETPRG
jgi:ribonuclease HI